MFTLMALVMVVKPVRVCTSGRTQAFFGSRNLCKGVVCLGAPSEVGIQGPEEIL